MSIDIMNLPFIVAISTKGITFNHMFFKFTLKLGLPVLLICVFIFPQFEPCVSCVLISYMKDTRVCNILQQSRFWRSKKVKIDEYHGKLFELRRFRPNSTFTCNLFCPLIVTCCYDFFAVLGIL